VATLADEDDSVLRGEAARAGAAFLVKPVSREDLLNTISSVHSGT
jgi:DNA-binding NarL/FixJ family response regulator